MLVLVLVVVVVVVVALLGGEWRPAGPGALPPCQLVAYMMDRSK